MIKASVIGATGYAGEELTRLLLMHPEVKVIKLGSQSYAGKRFDEVYPGFYKITDLILEKPDLKSFAEVSDVVFIALPHGIASKEVTEDILKKSVIIDLGADFRIKDSEVYENWYNVKHEGKDLLPQAVYGLPELHRDEIKSARLIANPGCYTTTSILALAPLLRNKLVDTKSIIIDAGSGVTGAGRGLKTDNLYSEVDENLKAYGIASHRHTPEIEQELSYLNGEPISLIFTPHLIPMQRGILATCYASLKKDLNQEELINIYNEFYKDEFFVRICPKQSTPQTRFVKGSNYLDIGLNIDTRTNRVIITAALDNLIKGAAGQAIQNMNIIFGLKETEGIDMIPACPI